MANTLSCPYPTDLDLLTVNGFNLSIVKLPGISFFCQEANIPEVTQGILSINTPLSVMKQPSSMLAYAPLEVAFHVDSHMTNYLAMYDWMRQLASPRTAKEFTELQFRSDNQLVDINSQVFSAGFIQVLGSNNLPIQTIEFIDLVPRSLSSAVFSYGLNDVKYLMGKASFDFTYYEIVK